MISVIIPVYNTASYLEECIQSVVKQTYKDWECLLVNDGSTMEVARFVMDGLVKIVE